MVSHGSRRQRRWYFSHALVARGDTFTWSQSSISLRVFPSCTARRVKVGNSSWHKPVATTYFMELIPPSLFARASPTFEPSSASYQYVSYSTMQALAKEQSIPSPVIPLDIIFSCRICNKSFSEIYEDRDETVLGLSDGINSDDRLVTLVYLTSCCHVICSRHLEGGAPNFHPAGTRPSAPCPVCSTEHDDHRPRELFSVRGFHQGEYDDAIPDCFFTVPPLELDKPGHDMEALRFHYISLIQFTQDTFGSHLKLRNQLTEARLDLDKAQTIASGECAKALRLEKEVERLHGVEADLEKFKSRMPAIEHYLKLIPKLADQNDQMKQRLAALGFQMPLEPLTFNGRFPLDDKSQCVDLVADMPGSSLQQTPNSPQPPQPRMSSIEQEQATVNSSTKRPLKRLRIDSPLPDWSMPTPLFDRRGAQSREMMPPPTKPVSKVRSLKKFWPPFLRSSGRNISSPILTHTTYNQSLGNAVPDDNSVTTNAPINGNHENLHPWASPRFNSDDNHGAADPESFHPVNGTESSTKHSLLPTEPSYLRLMDGLSRDNDLHLLLKDPRQDCAADVSPLQAKPNHQRA
ncbi:hypothetical protein BU24DRAFT_479362, partial [Aaosphaeria arxii CBS 175.79]